MKTKPLGNTGLEPTVLGLGCMSLGTDRKHAENLIAAALEEGINYFDTADLYDYGVNEEIVGQALAGSRDRVIIATKAGNRWNSKKDGWHWDPSKSYIKSAVKESLRRLRTDYIDIYQLHGGTIDDPIDETIEAFEELKDEGLIRQYGISSIRPNVIREYADRSNIKTVMMQYSLLDRRPEEEILPYLHDKGIGVMVRGPLAKGLLSDRTFENLDGGSLEENYLDYTNAELKELLSSIRSRLLNKDRVLTDISMQFVLSNPAVQTICAGASSVEQIKDNARAVNSRPLSAEELAFLQMISKASVYAEHR